MLKEALLLTEVKRRTVYSYTKFAIMCSFLLSSLAHEMYEELGRNLPTAVGSVTKFWRLAMKLAKITGKLVISIKQP